MKKNLHIIYVRSTSAFHLRRIRNAYILKWKNPDFWINKSQRAESCGYQVFGNIRVILACSAIVHVAYVIAHNNYLLRLHLTQARDVNIFTGLSVLSSSG